MMCIHRYLPIFFLRDLDPGGLQLDATTPNEATIILLHVSLSLGDMLRGETPGSYII